MNPDPRIRRAELLELPLAAIMTPVMRGKLKYESLTDGTVDLADIWLLNVAIAVSDENERRLSDVLREELETPWKS